jgi:hypothetical protein
MGNSPSKYSLISYFSNSAFILSIPRFYDISLKTTFRNILPAAVVVSGFKTITWKIVQSMEKR